MSETGKPAPKPQPVAAAASDFQAKLEPLLKMVAHQGKEIIITRNGYPIARVTPYAPQPGDPDFPVDCEIKVSPDLEQAGGESADQNPEEPPVLEDVIEIRDETGKIVERQRFTLQIFGDIVAPIDVEWDAEVNPDRVLNP